ncbi:hypothetical protein LAV_00200 [Sphingobium phage Lacusarx]|uniref:Uncharacterized protein n=1 Tax=Sphingobium phage Lacusarx TaxID=1980139 RepID=A0A1W6DXE3_9CAUD|nr:hypothetical protein FDH44_gp103 [Sphingobium phage Lacusarx]ARK07575.1 hypothetical protein LAV_00200 [Sphingobium phage Lacusarx]
MDIRIAYERHDAAGETLCIGFVEPDHEIMIPLLEAIDMPIEWRLNRAEIYLGRAGMEDCGRWFRALDPIRDFKTGEETYLTLHPGHVTPASYNRLKRIFCNV